MLCRVTDMFADTATGMGTDADTDVGTHTDTDRGADTEHRQCGVSRACTSRFKVLVLELSSG